MSAIKVKNSWNFLQNVVFVLHIVVQSFISFKWPIYYLFYSNKISEPLDGINIVLHLVGYRKVNITWPFQVWRWVVTVVESKGEACKEVIINCKGWQRHCQHLELL